jgi:hypothetical protein
MAESGALIETFQGALVRWQSWALERTAYVRFFYADEIPGALADYPHTIEALAEAKLAPETHLCVLYDDDASPLRLYSELAVALAEAEECGLVVVKIDWGDALQCR